MTRVYVVVEGQTEESFVNEVLARILWRCEVYVSPVLLGHKGGNPKYARVKNDILKLLKQDRSAYCSTMLDFYGLGADFPGLPVPASLQNVDKACHIEEAVKADIVSELPELRPERRFLPYIQMHEFEGLLFSDTAAFASGIGQPHHAREFQAIRDRFSTPEDINDDPLTAPSKQVRRVYPAYRKVLDGTLSAQAVGIAKMREECRHFHHWVEQLEALGT